MNPVRRSVLVCGAMLASLAAAETLKPRTKLASARERLELERDMPSSFGTWSIDPSAGALVTNPQQTELINRLYSQTLSRTYRNTENRRVMLSIAYGEDQRDGLEVHHPEVCYPAQGFRVRSNREDLLRLPWGSVRVRRLETEFNGQRFEPVTYWMMIGDTAYLDGWGKRLQEVSLGLKGFIADGLLFRVSSIGRDTPAEFQLQDRFVAGLLGALTPSWRKRYSGLA